VKRRVRTRTVGMSSGAYQMGGILARSNLERRSRKPGLPATTPVRKMPLRLGPSSMTGNMRIPVIIGRGSWRRRCGAATASAPSQEIVKVSKK
jgi:hypothetical protein